MAREQLQSASDRLRGAADDASNDLESKLEDQADRIQALAEREYSVDHGTLARVETKLSDLKTDAPDSIASEIDAALEDVRSFRSTVDGV